MKLFKNQQHGHVLYVIQMILLLKQMDVHKSECSGYNVVLNFIPVVFYLVYNKDRLVRIFVPNIYTGFVVKRPNSNFEGKGKIKNTKLVKDNHQNDILHNCNVIL
jgi:hypothetical protein